MSNDPTKEIFDVAVVGGGVAGAVTAAHLARAGWRVVVIEKEAHAHHKVCGEFISGEGLGHFRSLDVSLEQLGAVPIETVRVHTVHGSWSRSLPHTAFGLSRKILDEALLVHVQDVGARVERGERVKNVRPGSSCFQIETSSSRYCAQKVVLACGKHDVRAVHSRHAHSEELVGFKMHLRLTEAQALQTRSAVELFIFPGGYAGLSEVENGIFNFCFLLRKSELTSLGAHWQNLRLLLAGYNPVLRNRLMRAVPLMNRMVSIAPLPYGYLWEPKQTPSDVVPVGDQLAVIPSLTGEGMNIALLSAHCASSLLLNSNQDFLMTYARQMHEVFRPRLRWAMIAHHFFLSAFAPSLLYGVGRIWPSLVDAMISGTRCPALEEVTPVEMRQLV